jgi:hypothetical protein
VPQCDSMSAWSYLLERDYLAAWLRAFAFTQGVEVPIWLLFTRLLTTHLVNEVECSSRGLRVHEALALSAITHPFVWFFFPALAIPLRWSYGTTSIVSEVFAFAVEMALTQHWTRCSWRTAATASLLANGASLGLGELSRFLWNWP